MRGDLILIASFALLKLLIHLYFNRYYGYMHDELYFLSCGRHLSFGYVDHGPWVPWMARLSEELFGDRLSALRLIPALAGAMSTFLVGWTTRVLGGGRFAITLACLGFMTAPVFLLSGNILSLPSFEPFFWTLSALLLIRLIQTGDKRLWLWTGLVVGIGMLNKHSMLFFIMGLFVGVLAAPLRRDLLTPWPWAGLGIAFAVFLPNLVWQIQNEWPTLEFLSALNRRTMSRIPLSEFLIGQLLYVLPINSLVWMSGLGFFLFNRKASPEKDPPGSRYSVLAWIYLTVLAILIVAKGKIYYLGPAYPMLFAGGGVAIERYTDSRRRGWIRAALSILLVAGGLITAPISLPILPIKNLDGYVHTATMGAIKNSYELTGVYHDQFGWEEKVNKVAEVFQSLSDEEREECVILTRHYGEAGAVGRYGPALGLPSAVCGHLTHYLWGPGPKEGKIAVTLGISGEELRRLYDEVTLVTMVTCEECSRENSQVPIHICRKPRITLQEVWPALRAGAFD